MAAKPDFLQAEVQAHAATAAAAAGRKLSAMVPEACYVGELLKLDYGVAEVLVHDSHRQAAGGLPMGCFLLATRLNSGAPIDPLERTPSLSCSA